MNEILFRGQTRRKGQKVWMNGTPVESNWVYGGVLQGTGCYSIIYGCNDPDDKTTSNLNKWPVYTDTLGQYTGLKDKNGKRIFEGDVLRAEFEVDDKPCTSILLVVWFRNAWHTIQGRYNPELIEEDEIMGDCEVIGNIYDNPELMEEKNNE